MKKNKKPEWRKFEEAVAQFVQALDPRSNVTHDAKIPDKQTKSPRQRDVWIEAKLSSFIFIKIQVSCKRYKRRLGQLDIDHFYGEFLSSGADIPIIFSYSGFNKKAIIKSKELKIRCCQLFENTPAKIPKILFVPNAYATYPIVRLSVLEAPILKEITTWDQLFYLEDDFDGEKTTLLNYIVTKIKR